MLLAEFANRKPGLQVFQYARRTFLHFCLSLPYDFECLEKHRKKLPVTDFFDIKSKMVFFKCTFYFSIFFFSLSYTYKHSFLVFYFPLSLLPPFFLRESKCWAGSIFSFTVWEGIFFWAYKKEREKGGSTVFLKKLFPSLQTRSDKVRSPPLLLVAGRAEERRRRRTLCKKVGKQSVYEGPFRDFFFREVLYRGLVLCSIPRQWLL